MTSSIASGSDEKGEETKLTMSDLESNLTSSGGAVK